jgi:hypothetical protein
MLNFAITEFYEVRLKVLKLVHLGDTPIPIENYDAVVTCPQQGATWRVIGFSTVPSGLRKR